MAMDARERNHELVKVKQTLHSADFGEALKTALPQHLDAARMVRICETAIQVNPYLLECDRRSLWQAIITAAQLGLEPDGVTGQAYLIPFKGKVQFIPGYKGLISLAFNSGEVASLQAHEVCENDHFSYEYGLDEHLRHKPARGNRGEVTEFYAYSRMKNGAFAFEVMSVEEVNQIRDSSEGYKRNPGASPWSKHYVQMGRKTLIRRLANYLPRSVQKANAIEASYEAGKPALLDKETGELVLLEDNEGQQEKAEEVRTTAKQKTQSKLDAAAAGEVEEAEIIDPETGEVMSTDDAAELAKSAKAAKAAQEKPKPAATKPAAEKKGPDPKPAPAPEEEPEIPESLRRTDPEPAEEPALFGDD